MRRGYEDGLPARLNAGNTEIRSGFNNGPGVAYCREGRTHQVRLPILDDDPGKALICHPDAAPHCARVKRNGCDRHQEQDRGQEILPQRYDNTGRGPEDAAVFDGIHSLADLAVFHGNQTVSRNQKAPRARTLANSVPITEYRKWSGKR